MRRFIQNKQISGLGNPGKCAGPFLVKECIGPYHMTLTIYFLKVVSVVNTTASNVASRTIYVTEGCTVKPEQDLWPA